MSAELDSLDPSIEFGRSQGLWAYDMARSMSKGSDRADRPSIELVKDAANTAIRLFESAEEIQPGEMDAELVAQGLMSALEDRLDK